MFINYNLVSNIRKALFLLYLNTNNGANITEKEANYNRIIVQFNELAIINILGYRLLTNSEYIVSDSIAYLSIFYYIEVK